MSYLTELLENCNTFEEYTSNIENIKTALKEFETLVANCEDLDECLLDFDSALYKSTIVETEWRKQLNKTRKTLELFK